jgi:cyclopropane-fatty-acyl-phospholipid synthase
MLMITRQLEREFLNSCARIRWGSLRVLTPEDHVHDFGQGEPQAEMQIRDWAAVAAMAARGDIGMGEAYVAGLWDTPCVETLGQVAIRNMDYLNAYAYPNLWNRLKFRAVDRLFRRNSVRGAARNIRAHYDVGNEFYQLWLDRGMTYSSAMFAPGDNDLERAQNRKYDRILSHLGENEQVLEIGCGWGGFAERAADQGRHVTGQTISISQQGYSQARLDGRADIQLCDYRRSEGTFANIVSIEMIEAVGERYWPEYFGVLKSRLAEGGRAVVQAITVPDSYFDIYRQGSDYIRHYTFPGGMLLSDAVIAHHARRAGLKVASSHSFGQDYAETCRVWNQRLTAQSARAQTIGYGQEFLRSWRYYLEICAASFAAGQTSVVQVELRHA